MKTYALPIIGLSLILGACAPSQPAEQTEAEPVMIDMIPDGFTPDPVTVALGTKVCWVNSTDEGRWPASNIHPTHEIYSEFDPKEPVRPGETWCFVFGKPGIWKYHDHLLPEFVGTVNAE